MLFVEFPINLEHGSNILKYRDIEKDSWYYLYIDVETLNLLIENFGVISTHTIPTIRTNADNPTTSKYVHVKYCNADITMYCGINNSRLEFQALSNIEQNY